MDANCISLLCTGEMHKDNTVEFYSILYIYVQSYLISLSEMTKRDKSGEALRIIVELDELSS